MTDIANYDIKYIKNIDRLEKLKEAKWIQMKTIKKALENRKGGDNIILSSLLKNYTMEINKELSQTINLIEVFYRLYVKNEQLLTISQDEIQRYNLSKEILTIKEEIGRLNQEVDKLNRYMSIK